QSGPPERPADRRSRPGAGHPLAPRLVVSRGDPTTRRPPACDQYALTGAAGAQRPRTAHPPRQRRAGDPPGIRDAPGHHGAAPPHGLSAMCRGGGTVHQLGGRAAAAIAEVEALADEVMTWLAGDSNTDGA